MQPYFSVPPGLSKAEGKLSLIFRPILREMDGDGWEEREGATETFTASAETKYRFTVRYIVSGLGRPSGLIRDDYLMSQNSAVLVGYFDCDDTG